MGTIDTSLERIYIQLKDGNVGLAIMELDTYLMAWPNQQSREKLETLKSQYDLMADYWMQGAVDPDRERRAEARSARGDRARRAGAGRDRPADLRHSADADRRVP